MAPLLRACTVVLISLSTQALALPKEQLDCSGEALIGKSIAEARMRDVPRDEVKLQIILNIEEVSKNNTYLRQSLKRGFEHVDWLYDKQFSPKMAYVEVFRVCARRHGQYFTLHGDRLRLDPVRNETVEHVYIVGK